MQKLLKKTLFAAIALASFLPTLKAGTYTFDDATDDSRFYQTGTAFWLKTAQGGIDGTRWYTINNPNNTVPGMLVLNYAFPGEQESFTLGVNFLWRLDTSTTGTNAQKTSNQEILSLGIGRAADSATQFVPRNNGTETLGAQTNQQLHLGLALVAGSPGLVQAKGLSIVDGSRKYLSDATKTTATLQDDHWYYLEVTFTQALVATGYDVTLNLFESGADGTKGDTSLLSFTTTQYNAALKQEDVYAFLSGVSTMHSNVVGIDNFYISIPEGNSAALFLGGMAVVGSLAAAKKVSRKTAH